jgi:hypothetical protein
MQRIREVGLLQALVDGREDVIERGLPSEAPSPPAVEERARDRAKPADPSSPPPPSRLPPARDLRRLLGSRRSLRQAMIVSEVLGPPTSLRSR